MGENDPYYTYIPKIVTSFVFENWSGFGSFDPTPKVQES